MTLTIPLTEPEESKLLAEARAAGVTPETLVRQAIEPILADEPSPPADGSQKRKKSLLGLLAQYGPAPSDEEISENRREMFARFDERPR